LKGGRGDDINITRIIISLLLILITSSSVFSQTKTEHTSYTESTVFLILGILLFVLAVLFASIMIFDIKERQPGVETALIKRKKVLVDEQDLLMGHDFDGIQEFDNKPPAWFQILFAVTIVFAVAYMINYHVLGKQNLMLDEYNDEITTAQLQKEELNKSGVSITDENVTLLTDANEITQGKTIFNTNCTPCHGANLEGGVGPNLTDDYWIHGGGIKNIFHIITNGVMEKGMIPWKTQLSPKQIQQAASYIISMHGTKPPNAKAPEGQIWIDSTAIKTVPKTDTTKTVPGTIKKKKNKNT
jgi:cytochrome c oxidase cbb3-type subunit 3